MLYGGRMMISNGYGYSNLLRMGMHVLVFIFVMMLLVVIVREILKYVVLNKGNPALDHLEMRFANGEIDEKEFLRKKELLK